MSCDVGLKRVTYVRVAEVAANHVTLVWQSPGGAVELYEVSFWADDLRRNISLAYSFYTNITVRQLRQKSLYMFRVRLSCLFFIYNPFLCILYYVFLNEKFQLKPRRCGIRNPCRDKC